MSPQVFYIYLKNVCTAYTAVGQKKTLTNQGTYEKLQNQNSSSAFREGFARCRMSSNSSLKIFLHLPRERTPLSKIISFRCLQMLQLATITTSLKIRDPNSLLALMIISSNIKLESHEMFRNRQHHFLKVQPKKRCTKDSSTPKEQRT